jgi:hypothetical protein
MRRWLVVPVALVLAAVALYGLFTLRPHGHGPEIDEESRRRLLEVLAEDSH